MGTPAPEKYGVSFSRRDVFVLTAFLVFLLLFFSCVLTQPSHICLGRPGGDARSQFYGWRAYGFGEIAEGRFPLWNPYEFLGMPFVASLQSSMFYPTNWLCAFLPLGLAINLGIIINLFLSGLFAYLWCRRIGLRWPGAAVAAAAYVFGAPQLLRIYEGHWSFLCSMPWIPAILLCVEVFVSGRRRMLAVAGGAAAVAMQLFGGNPQYAFYGGIAAVLYLAGRSWQERAGGWRRATTATGCFVGMYVLGVAMAGVQIVPALEFLPLSARQGQISYEWVGQYSLAPESLATLLVPDLFGSDVGQYWGRWNLWEMSAYVGVVVAGLVLVAAFAGRRRKVVLTAVIAAVLLLLALGRYTPLLWILYKVVPGFGLFRSPARFLCPLSLFLGLLAGLGADAVAPRGKAHSDARPLGLRRAVWVVGGLALALVMAGLVLTPVAEAPSSGWQGFMRAMVGLGERPPLYLPREIASGDPTDFARFALPSQDEASISLLRSGVLLALLLVLLLLTTWLRLRNAWIALALLGLVAVDAWTFGRRYQKTFDPAEGGLTNEAVDFLRRDAQPSRFARWGSYNLPTWGGMAKGLTCIEGVQPNAPLLFRDVFWRVQGFDRTRQRTSYSLRPFERAGRKERFTLRPFRMLNLRYLVKDRSSRAPDPDGLKVVHEDERVRVFELPDVCPRAWLVHEVAVEKDPLAILESLKCSDRYKTVALFEGDPGFPVRPPGCDETEPEIVAYESNRVAVRVEPASSAFLILSDLYYPGWHATVDGRAAPLLKANYLMRAVPVPAGKHVVEFTYTPFSFRAGLGASLFACAIAVMLVWLHFRAERRNRDDAQPAPAR